MAVLVGRRFGKLLVVEQIRGDKNWMHRCVCDCGNEHFAQGNNLKAGRTTNCGCSRYKNNGLSLDNGKRSRLYYIWTSMHQRCTNPLATGYHNYGGRGIKVCSEWEDFGAFHRWAVSHGYKPNLTIERIDNNGDYRPGNCRWATTKEQGRNRRNNQLVTFRGETMLLMDWSERLGIRYVTLHARLFRYGWPVEQAFTQKPQRRTARQND